MITRTTYAIKADTDLFKKNGWTEHPLRRNGDILFIKGAQGVTVSVRHKDKWWEDKPMFQESDFHPDGSFIIRTVSENELPF